MMFVNEFSIRSRTKDSNLRRLVPAHAGFLLGHNSRYRATERGDYRTSHERQIQRRCTHAVSYD